MGAMNTNVRCNLPKDRKDTDGANERRYSWPIPSPRLPAEPPCWAL